MRSFGRVLAISALSTIALAGAAARAETAPLYPLDVEYQDPRVRETGTVPGQVRVRALGGFALGGSRHDAGRLGASIVGQSVGELMGTGHLGVRATTLASVPVALFGEAPLLFAARIGPSFHLLPFRTVDLGSYVDGGFAWIDAARSDRTFAPIVGAGTTLDIALTPYVGLHAEVGAQGGVQDRAGRAQTFWSLASMLGVGLMI